MSFRDSLKTLNTRKGVKKTPVSYSSYWMDFDEPVTARDGGTTEVEIADTERIMKLASVRRAVANFVRILTNKSEIDVTFSSGQQSYTNGKTVVISADADPEKFDSMVGLALHEGTHCMLSDFGFLQHVMGRSEWTIAYRAMSPALRSTIPVPSDIMVTDPMLTDLAAHVYAYQRVLGTIMNVIEDRRIDSYMYRNAAGYRPYYDAMYTRYFLNKEIDKNLRYNPAWRTPSVENYINWLLNIFNPHFDRNALPGLGAMVDMIDLKNIRRFDFATPMPNIVFSWETLDEVVPWESAMNAPTYMFDYNTMPKLWQTANDILYTIVQYVTRDQLDTLDTGTGEGDTQITMDGTSLTMPQMNSLENLDMGHGGEMPLPDGKFNEAAANKAMDRMKKVMSGDIRRKKLKARERDEIKQLESASAEIVQGGDKIVGDFPCLVTRKLTRGVLEASWFPFAHTIHNYTMNTQTVNTRYRS